MPRPLWKGAISFGLVHVPVDLYPAARQHSLNLDLLDRGTMDPIGYKKINKATGKEVASEDIVRGYEYKKGQYVVLAAEDFVRANPKATQTVEILAFVSAAQIAAMYHDTPYYLVPGKGGRKVYALLREAMKRADRIGIATVVIQSKQHLAAVIPTERLPMLNTLRYADEIRPTEAFKLPGAGLRDAGVNQKEMEMALKLIESMADEWRPDRYNDSYRDDLMARVKQKIKSGQTKEVVEPEPAPATPRRTADIIDLTALLKRSMRQHPHRESAKTGGVDKPTNAPKARTRKQSSRRAATKTAQRKRA